MKREKRVNALYATLTNKERALLAFQSIMEGDKEEAQRIAASVPLKRYVCADVEYERWYDAIWALADAYAIEYWRLTTQTYRCAQQAQYLEARNDREGAERVSQGFVEAYESLSALNCALDAVCAKYGLDIERIKEVGRIDSETLIPASWARDDEKILYLRRFEVLLDWKAAAHC